MRYVWTVLVTCFEDKQAHIYGVHGSRKSAENHIDTIIQDRVDHYKDTVDVRRTWWDNRLLEKYGFNCEMMEVGLFYKGSERWERIQLTRHIIGKRK